MHETGEVERRIAVEVHLVVQELVRAPAGYPDVGYLVLGDRRCILVARPCLVEDRARVVAEVLLVRVFLDLLNDSIGVD